MDHENQIYEYISFKLTVISSPNKLSDPLTGFDAFIAPCSRGRQRKTTLFMLY